MFVSINFQFRPYEFLCSSISFFENIGSILYIKECHLGQDKKVSVSPSIFTFENVPKNDFEIMSCQSVQSCVNGVCISQKTNQVFEINNSCTRIFKSCLYHSFSVHFCRVYNSLIIREKMLFSGPVLLQHLNIQLIYSR